MSVVDDSFDHPLKSEEHATMPLAGGIAGMGYQCGMLWGATLAAGAQAFRTFGPGPQAETAAMLAAQRLVESFRARTNNEINCLEITEINMQGENQALPILKFFLKGGPGICLSMTAKYAKDTFSGINVTFSKEYIESYPFPVSCAAMLAQKMGESEMHTVMAAGFAGGIGLSGGACGALGAAIWISGMNNSGEVVGFNYSDSWVGNMIEKYLESADYKFECAEVVGRKFESVDDHADYLRSGGCAGIIEALATI